MDLLFVFAAALTFYGVTLAPTLIWGDSAWFALQVLRWPVEYGTAGDHPLFVLLGRLFVLLPGEPARNLNLEAALFGALAVVLVYRCARQLGTSRAAAAVGAAALCVSHAFWLHAVIAEVYTANAFFLLATLSLLLDWRRDERWRYLVAALLVFAIGLTNHLVLAAVAPAAAVFVAATRPRTFLGRWFLAGAVGTIGVIIAVGFVVPAARAALHHIWVGPPSIWEYFNPRVQLGLTVREAGYYLLFLMYQFPSVSLPLGFVGIWALVRHDRRGAALLLLTIAVNAGVFIHHTGWQSQATSKFVFYIADYAVFAILCAIGADEMLRSRRWGVAMFALVALVPPALYALVPAAANLYGIDIVQAKSVPYRDNETYFLNPNKHGYDGARRFGEEAMRAAGRSAVIYGDFTPFAVLQYLQAVEGLRPDVLLRHASEGGRVPVRWTFDAGRRRPTYITTWTPDYYDLSGLTGSYDSVPAGPIIEVRPRDTP